MNQMDNANLVTMYENYLHHSRTNSAIRLMVSTCLNTYRITLMEWLLLGTVNFGPPHGLNMSSLARALEVTMPQVTVLKSHLLELKLVKQRADKHDRRNQYLLITGKGKSLLEKIEDNMSEAMNSWLQDVPGEQLRNYHLTVKQISQIPQLRPMQDTVLVPTGVKKDIIITQ